MRTITASAIQFTALLLLIISLSCSKPARNASDENIQQLLDQSEHYIDAYQLDSALILLYDLLPRLEADSLSQQNILAMKQIGDAYDTKGKYDSASHYLYNALRLAEQTGEEKTQIRILCSLGILYFNLRKTDDAISYYEQMFEMAQKQNDTINMVRAVNNMGNTYATLNNDFKKAIPCFENSILWAEKIGFEDAIMTSKTTLVQIYTETGELDKAYKMALEIAERYSDNYYTSFMLANIYLKKGEPARAIGLYKQILEKNTEFDTQEFHIALLDGLFQAYKEKKDYEHALEYYGRSRALSDSLHTVQSDKNIQDLKIAYETEKKEVKIAALEKEKRLMTELGIVGIAVLLLALATFFLLWRWTVQKRRVAEQQKQLAEQQVKQLEQEKQLVATQAVLDGETQERTRLARDLHDGLGSMLTGVKLNLLEMKKGVTLEYSDVERFDKALGLLDRSVNEMRRVAHHLMPDTLSRFGLKSAVSDFCNGLPPVRFAYYGDESRLDTKLEVMIYRSIHELVNNALKYAGADKIMVQIMQEPGRIAFTVQDDGCGFDPSAETRGIGLQNIRTRVMSYNGVINIESRAGEGTEVNVEVGL